tara:strand:- start:276 stop:1304 length:1029 start_codon:yes stop_codon:yes gene_type:complete
MIKKIFIVIFSFSFLLSEVCDLNDDGNQNIIDIIIMIDHILGNQDNACDINNDGVYNIIDIVQLISIIINGFTMDFVTIPEGVYYAPGSNQNNFVDSYEIGKYEVTNQQYLIYLNNAISSGAVWEGDCIESSGNSCINGFYFFDNEMYEKTFFILDNPRDYEIDEYYFGRFEYINEEFVINNIDYLDHPVVFVSWYGANHFAQYNGYRLPTYDEWIRAGRGTTYSWWPWTTGGSDNYLKLNSLNSDYNLPDDFIMPFPDGTTPVGYYNGINIGTLDGISSMGCYDIIGNVWEWISNPIVYNDDLRTSVGGGWDWDENNSRLVWVQSITKPRATWSTGFRVAK